jgi:putative ATP-dependent endonuclease of OLD family
MIGFIYLRALRTGSRALSLERNSLLDLILRVQGVRTGLWERSISRLRNLAPPIGNDAQELTRISHSIRRIGTPNQRKFFCEKDFAMIRGAPDADRV